MKSVTMPTLQLIGEVLLRSPYAEPTVRDFAGRWHALAAVLYCTRNHEPRARTEVNRGLTFDQNHRYVNLVAGALVEYRLGQEEPNPRGTWNIHLQRDYILRKLLHQAAQTYRGIIAKIPSSTRRGCGRGQPPNRDAIYFVMQ